MRKLPIPGGRAVSGRHSRRRWLPAVPVTVLAAAWSVFACNVPVFRYALERWPSDPYEILVYHRGELSGEHAKIVAWLESCGYHDSMRANLLVTKIDLAALAEEDLSQVREGWKDGIEPALPHVVVRYPRSSRIPVDAWSGPLSEEMAQRLVDSPARREIGKRLLSGDCAVWVFLESGTPEQDTEHATRLDGLLTKVTGELRELPFLRELSFTGSGPEADYGYTEVEVGGSEPPAAVAAEGSQDANATGQETGGETGGETLPISFSTLRVSRSDPAEHHLVAMLLGSEPDLATFTEPMAFPVFGRGRALYALVGKGITEDYVAEACSFLVGPCSCQVKGLNPGVDLLMAVDWDAGLDDTVVETRPLPPLTSLSAPPLVDPDAPASPPEADPGTASAAPVKANESVPAAAPETVIPSRDAAPSEAAFGRQLVTVLLILGGGLLALVVIGSFVVLRRGR